MVPTPSTLFEAVQRFADENVALSYFAALRWPDGPRCPRCGCSQVKRLRTRRVWQCGNCPKRHQFSARTGTVFEDCKIPIGKCMTAVWIIANAKNGVSSHELSRSLGITQKSAWFLLHRVRLAMQSKGFGRPLSGEVEADETFIGGRARNMHKGRRKEKGRGAVGKAVVMGLLERHGEVRTLVVPDTRRRTLQTKVHEHVEAGAEVFTDALASYTGLDRQYVHQVIDHAECYAKGKVHTNGLENFWSLFKRSVHGTYVAVAPFHLFRYLDEQSFRFNHRHDNDAGRFERAVSGAESRKLTYSALTAENTDGAEAENPPGQADAGGEEVR